MKNLTYFILYFLLCSVNLYGQNRIIVGKIIAEDLEPMIGVHIQGSDTTLFGETDINGQFKINISTQTEKLKFTFIGMEETEIVLKKDCDTVEVVMMYRGIYDFMSSRKIDRLRKERYEKIPDIYSEAYEKGIFKTNTTCYEREFVPYKAVLESISKELKKARKINKNNFESLKNGDIVTIPFGLDTSKKRISTNYSISNDCTAEDYDYVIKGEIINKHKRKLTLEIKIIEMPKYDSLEYRGNILNLGSNFKYEMEYYKVINKYDF